MLAGMLLRFVYRQNIIPVFPGGRKKAETYPMVHFFSFLFLKPQVIFSEDCCGKQHTVMTDDGTK